ncbi:MlaD family protein [Nocardia beijingensis]|uniref:MlaD family protein n=1 Tax=Nocardia beijingensis TaxID=95162 RepID=UPI00344FCA49
MTPSRARFRSRARVRAGALLLAATVAGGCGFNPADYPIAGPGVDAEHDVLHIEFASVLNLPAGAAVMVNGTNVGRMSSVSLRDDYALATVEVRKSLRLPADTRAELRQTTMLGDIYIALVPPPAGSAAPSLGDGDTITLAHTDPGPQIEEVIQRMSLFFNGGSLTALQNAVDRLNGVFPADLEHTRDMAAGLTVAIDAAAADTADLGRIIDGTQALTQRLIDDTDQLSLVFSDKGNTRLEASTYFTEGVLYILIQLQQLTNSLTWLIPRLPHLNAFLDTTVPLLRQPSDSPLQLNGNIGVLIDLAQNKLAPFLSEGPSINLTDLEVGGHDVTGNALTLLRVIGAVK